MVVVSFQIVDSYAAFTNHAFVLRETVQVAGLLREGASWSGVYSSIVEDNLFSLRSSESRKTLARVMRSRLEHVPSSLLEHLSDGDLDLQIYTNLFLILAQHALLRDFVEEVLLEHTDRLVYTLRKSDIRAWFDRKHQLEPDLESWSEATINKARVNLVNICLEGRLLAAVNDTASDKSPQGYNIQQNFIPDQLKRDLKAAGFAHYLTLMLDVSL